MRLSVPNTVKYPRGLLMAIENKPELNHYKFIRLAESWCKLKALDSNKSGIITNIDLDSKRKLIASALNISVASWYNYLAAFKHLGLVQQKRGNLHLSSYKTLRDMCGVTNQAFTQAEWTQAKPGNQIRAVWIKEKREQMQRAYMVKSGTIHRLKAEAALAHQASEFKECVEQYQIGNNQHRLSANPDMAISQQRISSAFGCGYNTSGHYWQVKLEKLGMLSVERERVIQGTTKSYCSPLGQNVFYSRTEQTRFLHLPNLSTAHV